MTNKILKNLVSSNGVIAFMALLLAVCSLAFYVGDAEFQEKYEINDTKLRLNGAGVMRILVNQTVAVGLYLDKKTKPKDAISDVPKRLELAYFQSSSGEDLINVTLKAIAKNLSEQQRQELNTRLEKLKEVYVDVEPGDRLSVTYFPDVGTKFDFNGSEQALIQGADFATAFFSMYIGVRPLDQRVKQILLREKKADRKLFF